MSEVIVHNIFFKPPLAIARVGGSPTPLDAFVWDSDKSIHGANRTVIRPSVTLKVLADGSLRPYLPNVIQFRDGELLRPVAPFFELWATVERKGHGCREEPFNLALLKDASIWLDSVEYTVTVGNRKAQVRTRSAACAYIARINTMGDDHARTPLNAFSPHNAGQEPLVFREHPIRLGEFQVIRPIARQAMGVDLSVLRVRFTPARGEVYGPPTAIAGPASPLPPGEALQPVTLGGRLHDIVPELNRILNPKSSWCEYIMDSLDQEDPQPSDSYDGANVGENRSWGVVDDSCDGIIEVQVAIKGVRHVAAARVLSSCPDYAPDRRPFNSLADDLVDRDKGRMDIGNSAHDLKETQAEVADLFERVFETSSLMNLDALRDRAVKENLSGTSPSEFPKAPHIDERSMTAGDRPYADDLAAALFPYPAPPPLPSGPQPTPLPYSDLAHFRHGPLCDEDTLIDFLNAYAERVRDLIRPPFGRFAELAAPKKRNKSARPFRDPRDDRDGYHDMRMPPYMRDSDQNSLSITYRQYHALMDLLDKITAPPSKAAVKAAAKAKAALGAERKAKKSPEQVRAQRIADSARLRREGPITRQVEEFTKRRGDR
jgi:hypothetical protein